MSHKRDVSPIGTSKFERPFNPPSTKTSPATSPVEQTPESLPFSRYHVARASNTSTVATWSTAPTSIDTAIDKAALEGELKGLQSPIRNNSTPTLPEEDYDDIDGTTEHDDLENEWPFRNDPLFADSDVLPSPQTLASVQDFLIYDSKGRSTTFGTLFNPEAATHQRQLIIFVRYFYCPACTAYLKAVTEGITTQDYYSIPIPTSITIIGCGAPDLIPHYKEFTGCPFTMYADPSRQLFKRLGMNISFNVGRRKPEYMEKGLLGASKDEIAILRKSLRDPQGLRKRDLMRGGNPMQVGGEFLFEEGRVVWCHRMRDYRGHAEIGELRRLIGLEV
jgi:hypothetical protein